MTQEERDLLERATAPPGTPVEGDDAGLRDGWLTLDRLAKASSAEAAPIDPYELAFAVRRRMSVRRSGFWSSSGWKVAAALLLGLCAGTAVWKATRPQVVAVDQGSTVSSPPKTTEVVRSAPKQTTRSATDEPWNDDWQVVAALVHWALLNYPVSDRMVPDEYQLVRADLNRFEAECSLESL